MPETNIDLGPLVNNRYKIQKTLGQGGFGRTYLASDLERFDELCVLKEFLPTAKQYANQKARELFEREARILYQIDHPQIPKFLSWFEYSDRLFIVQEYICGKTYLHLLNDRLSLDEHPFSGEEITQWLLGLLPVLGYLHDNNTVHRDISPENIMLPDGQSQPVLIDFGLVKQTVTEIWAMTSNHSALSAQTSYVGKFGYAPPEQIRMGQCYPCSDLYSLAVTAVVLLTGRDPSRLMSPSLEWQWSDYVSVDDTLNQVLTKMLAEKPSDRFQSAYDILQILKPFPTPTSQPFTKLEIEIDQFDKDQQLAEIEETDYFKQIHSEAEHLRNSLLSGPLSPTLSYNDLTSPNPLNPLDTANAPVDPATPNHTLFDQPFIQSCQQLLFQYVGVMANCILEDALDEHPNISKDQFIEVLATEIPNPENAQAFKAQLLSTLKQHPERSPSAHPSISLLEPSSGIWLNQSDIHPPPSVQNEAPSDPSPSLSLQEDHPLGREPKDTEPDYNDYQNDYQDANIFNPVPNHLPDAYDDNRMPIDGAPHLPYLEVEDNPPTAFSDDFIQQCTQILRRYVGMMAACILEDTLADFPTLSTTELIHKLTTEIPNPQKAQALKKELMALLETTTSPRSQAVNPFPEADATQASNYYSISLNSPNTRIQSTPFEPSLTQKNIDLAKYELCRLLGPMASYIVDDLLEDYPVLSAEQLFDKLADEIPDRRQADAFLKQVRRRLYD